MSAILSLIFISRTTTFHANQSTEIDSEWAQKDIPIIKSTTQIFTHQLNLIRDASRDRLTTERQPPNRLKIAWRVYIAIPYYQFYRFRAKMNNGRNICIWKSPKFAALNWWENATSAIKIDGSPLEVWNLECEFHVKMGVHVRHFRDYLRRF